MLKPLLLSAFRRAHEILAVHIHHFPLSEGARSCAEALQTPGRLVVYRHRQLRIQKSEKKNHISFLLDAQLTVGEPVLRRAEQLRLRTQQRIIATAEDSVLRTEMVNLESQEEDAPKRVLWFKPMSCLGQIRTHRRDETWSESLWQTCFASCVGAKIPDLPELPLSACGSKKVHHRHSWRP